MSNRVFKQLRQKVNFSIPVIISFLLGNTHEKSPQGKHVASPGDFSIYSKKYSGSIAKKGEKLSAAKKLIMLEY